jgi:hypothetical protein
VSTDLVEASGGGLRQHQRGVTRRVSAEAAERCLGVLEDAVVVVERLRHCEAGIRRAAASDQGEVVLLAGGEGRREGSSEGADGGKQQAA